MSPSSVLVLNKRLDHKLSTNHYMYYTISLLLTVLCTHYMIHASLVYIIGFSPIERIKQVTMLKLPPVFIDKRCTSVIWTRFHLNEPLFARTKAF